MGISIFKISLIIILCLNSKRILSQDIYRYKVISIDSTSNNYIFKMKNNKKVFLVVSPKVDSTYGHLKKIKLDEHYKIRLTKSTLRNSFKSSIPLTSISIEEKEVWKKGDDFDMYFSDDIISLYYNPSFKPCKKNKR